MFFSPAGQPGFKGVAMNNGQVRATLRIDGQNMPVEPGETFAFKGNNLKIVTQTGVNVILAFCHE